MKIPVRLIKSDKLSVHDKLVFILISSFNPSFPSIRRIARTLGISTSTVYHSIERLCEIGVLIRKSGDNSTSNRYNSVWGVSLEDTGVSRKDTHVYREAIPNQIKESDQLIIAKEISKIGGLVTRRMPK